MIENLRLKGKHGCFAEERNELRNFSVSMRLFIDASRAAQTDELCDTIDYPRAMAVAAEVFAGGSVRLVETLAEKIARRMFESFGLLIEIEVEVAKIGVEVGFDFDKIAVKIRRRREAFAQ